MKFVNSWGEVYRMSDRSYLRYLRAGVAGENPDAADFGKRIGVIRFTAIDAKPQDYAWALEGETDRAVDRAPTQHAAPADSVFAGHRPRGTGGITGDRRRR